MAPEIQAVVNATQAWLLSSRHVQVPFAWLEACVEWLQEEAGGAGHLSQQQINQQALDQWLLTDLRDLDYPVLPEGLSQAQKTELNGTFCVQVDSLLDISQPAYAQLQKWRGTDCTNDEVSAVTQATQRPWEAKPTRMLLLQVTDGVQSLEAMEYQSIPALSTALRPGVKLQLQGKMVCRLGMLLLGPSNVKVLGGEVEDLVDRNNQCKIFCRTLGLPEEQQQQQQGEEAPRAPQQGNQEVEDLELDDEELLASLENQEVERVQGEPVQDSGYRTLSASSIQSWRSSSNRSHDSIVSSRSGLTSSISGGSVRGQGHNNEQEDSEQFDLLPSDHFIRQEIPEHDMRDEDFPDEDFDDLPLDELDGVIIQESANVAAQSDLSRRNTPQDNNRPTATKPQTAQLDQQTLNDSGSQLGFSTTRSIAQKRDYQGSIRGAAGAAGLLATTGLKPSHKAEFVPNDEGDFMDEDMDSFLNEVQTYRVQSGKTGGANQPPVQKGQSRDREGSFESSHNTPQGHSCSPNTLGFESLSAKKDAQSSSSAPALTLTSPPFTYLRLLEDMMSRPQPHATEIRVKAFIVTLLGKLSSANGVWRVCATISDGTGYLDVELSDEVLTGLLGFTVVEKGVLKRDPARRGELDSGMRRCQEELVDMCCVMTVAVEPEGRKAVVTKAEPVTEKVIQELEQRVRDGRK